MSGAANSFPFLYQGLEHEVTDPGQLYLEPSGKVYNPQIQRELSQVGRVVDVESNADHNRAVMACSSVADNSNSKIARSCLM